MADRRLAVLAATALVAACSAEGAAPIPPREHRIAIVGDSFTEGSDEGGLGWRSWPAVLRHNLLEAGTIIDLEVAAEGSAGYADPGHSGNVLRDKADVLSGRDDLVIFFGGVNDGHVNPENSGPPSATPSPRQGPRLLVRSSSSSAPRGPPRIHPPTSPRCATSSTARPARRAWNSSTRWPRSGSSTPPS